MPTEKKNCPICEVKGISQKEGELNKCPFCGHLFRPSDPSA